MKTLQKIFFSIFMLTLLSMPAFADVVVHETTTTSRGWGHPDTFIGDFFYLVGDVVEFPFNLLGNLF